MLEICNDLILAHRCRAGAVHPNISARFAVARNAIYAWAYLQSQVPGFPKQRLARIYSDGRSEGLHFEDLPQSLREDWAAFVERNRATPSTDLTEYVADDAAPLRESVRRPAADDAGSLRQSVRRPAAKMSPVRLDNLKSAVTLAANAMIAAGGSPQGLRDLVDPRVAEQTVQAALLRQRRKNPAARPKHSYLKSLAGDLLKIGRLIGISASDEQMLVDLRDDYDPYLLEIRKNDKGGDKRIFDTERMGPRHVDRLDQFNDPVKLHAWFQMMPLLYQRMKDIVRAGRAPTPIEVNDAIVCVLHAITQSCPVRRENLAKITIGGREPWLRLPAFRGDRARLTIPAQFVKNLKQIDAELTAEAAEIVRCFIEHFRPAMVKAVRASSDNRFLFPAAGKKARSGGRRRICEAESGYGGAVLRRAGRQRSPGDHR